MLVHARAPRHVLLDFFVAAPGAGRARARSELVPIAGLLHRGRVAGLQRRRGLVRGAGHAGGARSRRCARFGTMPLAELAAPAARLARDGRRGERRAGVLHRDPGADPHPLPRRRRRSTRPSGQLLREGDIFRFPELADALERLGAEGAEPFYRGDVARGGRRTGCSSGGGTLGREDLAAYEPIAREPVARALRGREVLTNPPPSSGGILIAYALELLERARRRPASRSSSRRWRRRRRRAPRSSAGLYEGFAERSSPTASTRRRARRSGSPARGRAGDGSARPPTSPPSTPRAAAPASPARTGPARA